MFKNSFPNTINIGHHTTLRKSSIKITLRYKSVQPFTGNFSYCDVKNSGHFLWTVNYTLIKAAFIQYKTSAVACSCLWRTTNKIKTSESALWRVAFSENFRNLDASKVHFLLQTRYLLNAWGLDSVYQKCSLKFLDSTNCNPMDFAYVENVSTQSLLEYGIAIPLHFSIVVRLGYGLTV